MRVSRIHLAATISLWLLSAATIHAQAEPAANSEPARIVVTSVRPQPRGGTTTTASYGLTREDLQAIRELPTVKHVAPIREVRRTARVGDRLTEARVFGISGDYATLAPLELESGRFLLAEDEKELRNVAVISAALARQLFAGGEPLGRSIRLGDDYFLVVGVVARPRDGEEASRDIYLPLSTMRSRWGDRELRRESGSFSLEVFELSRIEIRLQEEADAAMTAADIEQLLDGLHEDATYQIAVPSRP